MPQLPLSPVTPTDHLKHVWLKYKTQGYIPALILSETSTHLTLQTSPQTNPVTVPITDTEKMNHPKFDRVDDMAELGYLNEASVIHNIKQRYSTNLIYTYSGLFLVAVNPYKRLPIYSHDVIKSYKGKKRSEMPPHIYAVADHAYHDMLQDRESQSILITGESGAGKTENTKKVIQYLASVANESEGTLEEQILQANPILEAFGNAQTVRNNNSSRFGKFVRIGFDRQGKISGANIERYLLEKSRVVCQNERERNYHVFYQLLKGASVELKEKFYLDGGLSDYVYTSKSNHSIQDVDDVQEYKELLKAFQIIGLSEKEIEDFLSIVACVLLIGNMQVKNGREDQAMLVESSFCEKFCKLAGVSVSEFSKGLLRPKMKAGRDWVVQSRNSSQVIYSIESLAKSLYERMFEKLVSRVNASIDNNVRSTFVGVLDIAGFEIFEINSFEQLLINYTNEKLQQYFNHHMFVVEQEEYKREGIEWKFIDFGLDLQPCIDLIESVKNPIGVLSLLDEECVMPKATDKTFLDKLNSIWKGKDKYDTSRFNASFMIQHYSGRVEYSVDSWLDRNKDPLNDNLVELLATASNPFMSSLFVDFNEKTKKGLFRTVGQRHKEQLNSLLRLLYSTSPHFVRCIVPNEEKKAGKINAELILHQLRCNGVLEGIRICRQGFPNRVLFNEFKSRYEILAPKVVPKNLVDGKQCTSLLLDALGLDTNQYKLGHSKVFFRTGVLQELEETRDVKLNEILVKLQSASRGWIARTKFRSTIEKSKAIKAIQRNARIYIQLREWSWWKLYSKVKPLLNVTRVDDEMKSKDKELKSLEETHNKLKEEYELVQKEKSRMETEKKELEKTLDEDKSVHNNTVEMLKRLQLRIEELEEEKSRIEVENSKRAESLIEKSTTELERNGQEYEEKIKQMNFTFTKESERLDREVKRLEGERKELEGSLIQHKDKSEELKNRIEELQEHLNGIVQSRDQLQQSLANTLQEFKKTETNLSNEKAKNAELEGVNNTTKLEMKTLTDEKNSNDYNLNKNIKELQAQLVTLENENINLKEIKQTTNKQLTELKSDLEEVQFENSKLTQRNNRNESELKDLKEMLENKGIDQLKQSDLIQFKESELTSLKKLYSDVSADYSQLQHTHSTTTAQLQEQITNLEQSNSALSNTKQSLEKQLNSTLLQLDDLTLTHQSTDTSKRSLELQLSQLNSQLSHLNDTNSTLGADKNALTEKLANSSTTYKELDEAYKSLEREKLQFSSQVTELRQSNEDEQRKRSSLESLKSKLSSEVDQLTTLLDEQQIQTMEISRKYTLKCQEHDASVDKFTLSISAKDTEFDEYKRKMDKQVSELQVSSDSLSLQLSSIEKLKQRLTGEVEDLRHELDVNHNNQRSLDKYVKQLEVQLNDSKSLLDVERHQKELNDASVRKLSAQLDAVNRELDEKNIAYSALTKSKSDVELELKTLVDEIGQGGKNLYEMEKAKKKLESRAEVLEQSLGEREEEVRKLNERYTHLEEQHTEYRKRVEADLSEKDALLEDTRRSLMREVNTLGEQLEMEIAAKNEFLKAKKRLESELESHVNQADSSLKSKADLESKKKKSDMLLKEVQSLLEDEQKKSREWMEMGQRLEKKCNTMQSDMERLETALEGAERIKKTLEKQVLDLHNELDGGEDSKASLAETKKKLEKQIGYLQDQLDHEVELREELEAQKRENLKELEYFKSKVRDDADARLEQAEEQRKALMATQRLLQQELDDKKNEVLTLEKTKKMLAQELESVLARLEVEIAAKNDESAQRKRMVSDLEDSQARLQREATKANELTELVNVYRSKTDDLMNKLEAAELGRIKAEKNESSLRIQTKEIEDCLNEVTNDCKLGEEKIKSLEEQIISLNEKMEEDAMELADFTIVKRRLMQELEQERERYKRDIAEEEQVLNATRKKYQKEVLELTNELESQKSAALCLKENNRSLQSELDDLHQKIENDMQSSTNWRREKERLEGRIADLQKAYEEGNKVHDEMSRQITQLTIKQRELHISIEDKDAALASLEKSKRNLEDRLSEIEDQYHRASKGLLEIGRSFEVLDQEANALRSALEGERDALAQANEKLRKAESSLAEKQTFLLKEQDSNMELERQRLLNEKQIKELNARIVDLEAATLSDTSRSSKRLESRIEELQSTLDAEVAEKNEHIRNARKNDRLLRDLQFQLQEKDKAKQRLDEDYEKAEQKWKKLKQHVDEVELSENALQMEKRRLERERDECKERAGRFEKEVERLKGRLERAG